MKFSTLDGLNNIMDYSDNSYTWTLGGQDGSYSQNQLTSPSQEYSGYGDIGSSSHQDYPNQERKYVCLHVGCTARPFGRSIDLDRHIKQVHAEESNNDKFICDYKRCLRKDRIFSRKDHFREHLREYHKEDILQRDKSATKDWSETRNINPDWWRCSKCFGRVEVAVSGYACPDCRFLCETVRQRLRADRHLRQDTRTIQQPETIQHPENIRHPAAIQHSKAIRHSEVIRNPATLANEAHLLPTESALASREEWKDLLKCTPETLRWSLQFNEVSGVGGCWTCTPSDLANSESVPLTIAGSPVVIPVGYHYPVMTASTPPPDPHPRFISPVEFLTDNVIYELFDVYAEAIGCYVLLNGWLQIIVPVDFDYEYAVSHLPHEFGGLKVSFIQEGLIPTARESGGQPSSATQVASPLTTISGTVQNQSGLPLAVQGVLPQFSSAESSSLNIGSAVRVSMRNFKTKERYEGRIGVRTQSNGRSYVTMSTHLITNALEASKLGPLQPEDWPQEIKVLAGSTETELGPIAETFDAAAKVFPNGFVHDTSIIDVSNASPAKISGIRSPVPLTWLSQQEWSSLQFTSRNLFLLNDQERAAKTISILPSNYQMVGQAIFKTQRKYRKRSLLDSLLGIDQDNDVETWASLVARSILYRVHPEFPIRGGQSGTAVCFSEHAAGGGESAKLAGFTSFVQMVSDVQRYDLEGEKFEKRLYEGRVAFYGAFQAPKKLRDDHVIM